MLFVWVFDTYGIEKAEGGSHFVIWGVAAAIAVLFLGEQLQHSYELHIMQQKTWSHYFWALQTAWITFCETAAGFCWLYFNRLGKNGDSFLGISDATTLILIGGGMMLLGLGIEHVVEGGALIPAKDKDKTEGMPVA